MFQVLRAPDFRWFFTGYLTSKLGTAMAPIAIAFAVLRTGGGPTSLGYVMAARILPLVLLLLFGGVFADRLGGRKVMIASDVLRFLAQTTFGVLLAIGHATVPAMAVIAVLSGVGEGIFTPSLQALIPKLTADDRLADANSLLSVANSTAGIAGPALGALVAATAGPATVLFADAATYAVSVIVLIRLSAIPQPHQHQSSIIRDLRDGWHEFASRTWLWATTLQFCLFNALVWAPYLVLGPVVAHDRLGGTGSFGLIMAANSAGAITAGLAILGRKPRRPFLLAVIATFGYALTPAALASHLGLPWVCAAAAVTGAGSAIGGALESTVIQQRIPADALGRISAYQTLGAFALGPLGLAAAGPLAAVFGVPGFLAFGAVFQIASVAVTIALPSVRRLDLSEASANLVETVQTVPDASREPTSRR